MKFINTSKKNSNQVRFSFIHSQKTSLFDSAITLLSKFNAVASFDIVELLNRDDRKFYHQGLSDLGWNSVIKNQIILMGETLGLDKEEIQKTLSSLVYNLNLRSEVDIFVQPENNVSPSSESEFDLRKSLLCVFSVSEYMLCFYEKETPSADKDTSGLELISHDLQNKVLEDSLSFCTSEHEENSVVLFVFSNLSKEVIHFIKKNNTKIEPLPLSVFISSPEKYFPHYPSIMCANSTIKEAVSATLANLFSHKYGKVISNTLFLGSEKALILPCKKPDFLYKNKTENQIFFFSLGLLLSNKSFTSGYNLLRAIIFTAKDSSTEPIGKKKKTEEEIKNLISHNKNFQIKNPHRTNTLFSKEFGLSVLEKFEQDNVIDFVNSNFENLEKREKSFVVTAYWDGLANELVSQINSICISYKIAEILVNGEVILKHKNLKKIKGNIWTIFLFKSSNLKSKTKNNLSNLTAELSKIEDLNLIEVRVLYS